MEDVDPPASELPASTTRAPGETGTDFPMSARAKNPDFWQTVKSLIGKDLSRVSMPVWLNEPLSFLQRSAEDIEYSELLDRAAAADDPTDRAALVAAFVVSHYSSTPRRITKPFNPLLGETFEFVSHERGVAFIAEQVSHHPPRSAVHVAGRGWQYATSHQLRNSFHGNSLDAWPEGRAHVYLSAFDEHYVYEQVRTTVHNLVGGSRWIDNSGKMTIQEVTKGDVTMSLHFKRFSMFFSETQMHGEVKGKLVYRSTEGQVVTRKLSGNWQESFSCDGDELWRVTPRPAREDTAGYSMTAWSWVLNCPPSAELRATLPRTDSRLRPDQRLLERGDLDGASKEKNRLEDKQRTTRSAMEERGETYEARWFERRLRAPGDCEEWCYTHRYFATMRAGAWPDSLPDIF